MATVVVLVLFCLASAAWSSSSPAGVETSSRSTAQVTASSAVVGTDSPSPLPPLVTSSPASTLTSSHETSSFQANNLTTVTAHTTTTADRFRMKCYDGIGCFNNSYPFNNDGLTMPADPAHVGTEFRLYTRGDDLTLYKVLTYNVSDASVRDAHFNASRRTRVIIHGFSNTVEEPWLHDIKDAFLRVEDSNVIIVGWGPGANSGYDQAVANTRMVAKQLRLLLERLEREAGLDLKDVHLIGHSLGAHTSGDAGRQLGGRVGRITAMDPAGPQFENYNNYVIVDRTDAVFVDTIHTNAKPLIAGGAGMFTATGHVDFYVNGGRTQPGCKDGISALLSGASISCSHSRSHEVFHESITSECAFTAYPCLNQTYFQLGQCLDCEPGGCSELGLYADQHAARGPRYLNTQAQIPYCGFHYSVTVHAGAGANTKGSIHVSLQGSWGSTGLMAVTEKEDQAITASSNLVGVVVATAEVGHVRSVTVRYLKYPGAMGWSFLGGGSDSVRIDAVDVLSGESGERVRVCIPEQQRQLTHDHEVLIPVSASGTC